MADVKFVSNEIDDFAEGGGLYPGGTGVIKELKYVLWDYNGKQPPNSALAVKMVFLPNDGSNEGKPVEHYWSCGEVADFAPDPEGGRLVALKARDQQNDNTNWALALKMFKSNCGLERGKLSTEKGIRVLEDTVATFIRTDQPEREGLKEQKKEGERKFKQTTLVPTKAKFPWEKRGGAAASAPAPAQAATAKNPVSTPAATSNGAGETDLSVVIKDLLTSAGGNVEYAELPKLLLGVLGSLERSVRTAMVGKAKDPAFITELAKENGWTFDGKELVL